MISEKFYHQKRNSKQSICTCEPKTKPDIKHVLSKNDHLVDWLFPKCSHWLLVFLTGKLVKREMHVTETKSIWKENCYSVQKNHKAPRTSLSMWLPYVDAGPFQRHTSDESEGRRTSRTQCGIISSRTSPGDYLLHIFKPKRQAIQVVQMSSMTAILQETVDKWVFTGNSVSHHCGSTLSPECNLSKVKPRDLTASYRKGDRGTRQTHHEM